MKSVAPSRQGNDGDTEAKGFQILFLLGCQSFHRKWVRAGLLASCGTLGQWAGHCQLASRGAPPG